MREGSTDANGAVRGSILAIRAGGIDSIESAIAYYEERMETLVRVTEARNGDVAQPAWSARGCASVDRFRKRLSQHPPGDRLDRLGLPAKEPVLAKRLAGGRRRSFSAFHSDQREAPRKRFCFTVRRELAAVVLVMDDEDPRPDAREIKIAQPGLPPAAFASSQVDGRCKDDARNFQPHCLPDIAGRHRASARAHQVQREGRKSLLDVAHDLVHIRRVIPSGAKFVAHSRLLIRRCIDDGRYDPVAREFSTASHKEVVRPELRASTFHAEANRTSATREQDGYASCVPAFRNNQEIGLDDPVTGG